MRIFAFLNIGYEKELGSLQVGTTGDITVLDLEEGGFTFQDCFNHTLTCDKRFTPLITILSREKLEVD